MNRTCVQMERPPISFMGISRWELSFANWTLFDQKRISPSNVAWFKSLLCFPISPCFIPYPLGFLVGHFGLLSYRPLTLEKNYKTKIWLAWPDFCFFLLYFIYSLINPTKWLWETPLRISNRLMVRFILFMFLNLPKSSFLVKNLVITAVIFL